MRGAASVSYLPIAADHRVDPNEDDRVWALFNWDLEGWQSFVSDPGVPRCSGRRGTLAGRRSRSSAVPATPSAIASNAATDSSTTHNQRSQS